MYISLVTACMIERGRAGIYLLFQVKEGAKIIKCKEAASLFKSSFIVGPTLKQTEIAKTCIIFLGNLTTKIVLN